MANHKDPLSRSFGTIRQAASLLESEGADPVAFFQRLIDDPTFRGKVAELARKKPFTPRPRIVKYQVPEQLHPEYIQALLADIYFRMGGVPKDLTPEDVRTVLLQLDDRKISMLMSRFGLIDGESQQWAVIGKEHGLSGSVAREHVNNVKYKIRDGLEALRDERFQELMSLSLEDFGLSPECITFLHVSRAMSLVGDLYEDGWRYLRIGAGINHLKEVEAKFAEHGLKLRP